MQDKILSVDAFRKKITEEVRAICDSRGYNYDNEQKRGVAFQEWFGGLLSQHEKLEWDGDEGLFSSRDLKIDVAIEDSDEKALYLVQTKLINISANPPANDEEVSDFFNRHQMLLKHEWVHKHASEASLEYIGDYESRLDQGWSVHFYFVTTQKASDRTKEHVAELQLDANQMHPTVAFHLLDFSALKEFFVEAQTLEQKIPEIVSFDLPKEKYIYLKTPRPTLVAVVKANALVGLYKKERESLFAYNIRSFLGRKGINKEIGLTAKDSPDKFFYFNNGVSAICTRFTIDEKTGRFTGEKFQVINGAQTIGTLNHVRKLSSEVEILLRVTEGESVSTEKGFNADVIKYNNTQTVIKSSDFRANDPIQLFLEQKFQALRPRGAIERRVSYFRKRSFKKAVGSDALRLEDLAKIRFAWLEEPTRAIADPKSLWAYESDGGAYERAFGVNGVLADFWEDEIFTQAVFAVVAYLKICEQIDETIKKDRAKNIYLRRLRFFALSLFKEFCDIRKVSISDTLASQAKFNQLFAEFWPEALRELIRAYQTAQREKITLFSLARSEGRWAMIKEAFSAFLQAT